LPHQETAVVQQLGYDIHNAKTRVMSRVDVLKAQTLAQVHKTTSAIETESHATRFHVHRISQGVKRIDEDMKSVSRGIGEVLTQGTFLDGKVDVVDDHVMSMSSDLKEVAQTLKDMKEEYKQDHARLSDYMSQDQMVSKSEVAGLVQTAVYNMISEMVYRQSRLGT
jgi:response regulator RpfG family c-di-GMP phosphodiesterase